MPNIWSIHDDDEDHDEDGDKAKPSDGSDSHDSEDHHEVVTSSLEDELEKPSFLRRLGRRHKDEDKPDDEPKDLDS